MSKRGEHRFARRLLSGALIGALALGTLGADPAEPTCAVEELNEPGWASNRPTSPNRDNRSLSFGSSENYVGFSVGQEQGLGAVVADVSSLQISRDAGCTWELGYQFDRDLDPAGEIEPSTARFVDVVMSDKTQGPERIVALLYDIDAGYTARVRTLVSTDGGASFAVGGLGLPDAMDLLPNNEGACGDNLGCELQISPSDPKRVYVSLTPGFGQPYFFVSTDGGMNFRRQNGGTVPFTSDTRDGYPTSFQVDREDPSLLWGSEESGSVITSTNGGDTWTVHDLGEAFEQTVDSDKSLRNTLGVATTSDGVFSQVVALVEDTSSNKWTAWSLDSGQTWQFFDSNTRGDFLAIEGTATPGRFVATTVNGAWVLDFAAQTEDSLALWSLIGGRELGPLFDIHPLTDSTTIWFRGPFSLPVIGDLEFAAPIEVPQFDFSVPEFDPLDPLGRLPGEIKNANPTVYLEVDQVTTRDIVLDLPRTPTPLDVFFVFDQSGSMSEEIEALAAGMAEITNELLRRRIDLNVGLGGYSGGWRYQRHRDIGRPDPEFQQKLENLSRQLGGGFETAYTALHQIATGSGLPNSSAGLGPPEGWQANWRNGSIRLVVNLTDEPLQVERFPSAKEAITELAQRQIMVVNLISDETAAGDAALGPQGSPGSVDSGISEDDYAYGPAARLSRMTDTLAPPSGVDCGGDGEIDIQEGEPLSCYVSPVVAAGSTSAELDEVLPDLAEVVVEILEGVTEVHPISFFRQYPEVITGIRPLDPVVVDIRDPQYIRARATITCPIAYASSTINPLITAVASSRILGSTNFNITCGPAGGAVAPAIRPAAALAAVPPAAPPPPIPVPVTVTAGAQAAAGAQAPATATSLVPQVGVAAVTQHEQQHQVASIGKTGPDTSDDASFAFEYSARRDPNNAPVTLAIGAAMAMGAGALARRRQGAGRPGRVRIR